MTRFPLFVCDDNDIAILRMCIGNDRVHLCSRITYLHLCDMVNNHHVLLNKILDALCGHHTLDGYLCSIGQVTKNSSVLRDRWIEELFKFNGVEI